MAESDIGFDRLSINPIDLPIEELEDLISKWEGPEEQQIMIWELSSEEAASYLATVDKLQEIANFGPSDLASRARKCLQIAASRLNTEFKYLLSAHSELVNKDWLPDGFSTQSFSSNADASEESLEEQNGNQTNPAEPQSLREQTYTVDLLQPTIVSDLSDIAQRMIAMGRAQDCIQSYMSVRKSLLEDSMFHLGVDTKSTVEEIQRMSWDNLEQSVKKFLKGMKIAMRFMFASERFLCDEVFAASIEDSDRCFAEMANDMAIRVLGTFKAVATLPASPERIFRLLDMYETLKELLPEIERVFVGDESECVRIETLEVLDLLGSTVKRTFMELRTAIQNDTSKNAVAGGAIHPLTRYVMNYLGLLSEYLDTLEEIYSDEEESSSVNGVTEVEETDNPRQKTVFHKKVMLVLDALLNNINENARLYRDEALKYIFLMNNILYVVQKAQSSEMGEVIGESWLRKQSSDVRLQSVNYQRQAWPKIFNYLRDEGIRGPGYSVSKEVLKERFKSFNSAIEEIHRTQSSWVVPDLKLRNELRMRISGFLLPGYRSFLGRYRDHLEGIRHSERYLKYTVEDLETLVNDLFEGASSSMNRRWSFSSS